MRTPALMQTTSRALSVRSPYLELRELFGTAPRSDASGLAHARNILKQLRSDPYASQQFHERIDKLGRLLEQWLGPTRQESTAAGESREAMLLELAHLETEQRLRSWLMEIVR